MCARGLGNHGLGENYGISIPPIKEFGSRVSLLIRSIFNLFLWEEIKQALKGRKCVMVDCYLIAVLLFVTLVCLLS